MRHQQGTEAGNRAAMADKLGVCQWFHYEAYDDLARAVDLLHELGVRHVRTGVSWADFHRPRGAEWYRHQMGALAEFDVLLSVWHTPPSRAEGGECASPPRRLADYADFIEQLAQELGDGFSRFELWNEPNNRYKWDFERYDPDWSKFGEMICRAGRAARRAGKPSVLGGMIPVDPHWLNLMESYGVLEHVDAVAIHAFPGMWWDDQPNWEWHSHWKGWQAKFAAITPHARGLPVWVTETGLATWDVELRRPARHSMQRERLEKAAAAPAERMYWYSLIDLDPRRDAIEGFHVDENEYHLGLVTFDGRKKPAWWTFRDLLGGRADAARPAAGRRDHS